MGRKMRKSEYEDIIVNTSHMKLKTVLFVIAVVVAVTAFAFGVSRIGYKEEGYYEVEAEGDSDVPLYANGFTFTGYFTGSSSTIRETLNEAKAVYGPALKRAYILLDPDNTYEGYVNLATLNSSIGQEIEVPAELYDVLCDAWDKTQEGSGFNMFAGALYSHWMGILVLDDPEDFDPAVNEEEAARISRLAEETGREGIFEFTVIDEDAHIIRIDAAQSYLDLLEDNEESLNLLNLGTMHDAYVLSLVSAVLEEQGVNYGYLTSDSGLIVSLSGHAGGEFCLYGYCESEENGSRTNISGTGTITRLGTVNISGSTAFAGFRTFALSDDENFFYELSLDGIHYRRDPYIDMGGTGFNNELDSAYAVSFTGDIVEAAYACMKMNSYCAGPAEGDLDGLAGGSSRLLTAYTVYGSGGSKVNVSSRLSGQLAVYEGIETAVY